jgi:hypothetical protein
MVMTSMRTAPQPATARAVGRPARGCVRTQRARPTGCGGGQPRRRVDAQGPGAVDPAHHERERHQRPVLELEQVARRVGHHRRDPPTGHIGGIHHLGTDQLVHPEGVGVVVDRRRLRPQHRTDEGLGLGAAVDALERHDPAIPVWP